LAAVKSSAEKRHEQSLKRRYRNKVVKSRVRTRIRAFLSALDQRNREQAEGELAQVERLVDSAVNKGVYHRNTADRTKSRLHKKLKSLD